MVAIFALVSARGLAEHVESPKHESYGKHGRQEDERVHEAGLHGSDPFLLSVLRAGRLERAEAESAACPEERRNGKEWIDES
jgi:hypothetical protein